jgi:protein phosphatase
LIKRSSKTALKTLTEVSAFSLGNTESFAASIIFQAEKTNRLYILISSGVKGVALKAASQISEKMLQGVTQEERGDSINGFFQRLIENCSIPFCVLVLMNNEMFTLSKGESYIYAFDLNSQELYGIHDDFLMLKHFSGYIYLVNSQREQKILDYLAQSSQKNLLPSEISAKCIDLVKSIGISNFSMSLLGTYLPLVSVSRLRKLKLYSAYSDVGRKRSINEDSVLASNIKYSSSGELWSSFILSVADGAGGHLHGEEASREALRLSFAESLRSNIINGGDKENFLFNLRKSIQTTNHSIMGLRESKRSDLATTLTMALVVGNNVFVAHCGDSRMYMLKGSDLSLVTEDHKYVIDLVKAGVMSIDEAKVSPQRNILTSALGMKNPRIDFKHLSLDGDETLLLCSDGLTDLVDDAEIKAYLQHYKYPSLISQALIDIANKRGGFDNISVAMLVPGSIIF